MKMNPKRFLSFTFLFCRIWFIFLLRVVIICVIANSQTNEILFHFTNCHISCLPKILSKRVELHFLFHERFMFCIKISPVFFMLFVGYWANLIKRGISYQKIEQTSTSIYSFKS